MFSESYLDEAVDKLIYEKFGVSIARKHVAEIGSLVSCQAPGSGGKLVAMIPWFLWSLGFEFVLITATEKLHKIMRSTNISYHAIGKATLEKVTTDNNFTDWGQYYDTNPLVGIIDIKATLYRSMLNEFTKKFNLKSVDIHYSTDTNHVFSRKQIGVKTYDSQT